MRCLECNYDHETEAPGAGCLRARTDEDLRRECIRRGWGVILPAKIPQPSRQSMNDDEYERYRSKLKLEMLQGLGPDTCTQTACPSREEVLGLIKSGEADILLSVGEGGKPVEHFAVRFHDRGLGERAREDSLDLYGLRHQPVESP